jgi:hypothetical protein
MGLEGAGVMRVSGLPAGWDSGMLGILWFAAPEELARVVALGAEMDWDGIDGVVFLRGMLMFLWIWIIVSKVQYRSSIFSVPILQPFPRIQLPCSA